jgi:hypothetical protein
MDRLEVLAVEYERVSGECTASIEHRTQIISFGLGTVAALMGGSLAFAGEGPAKTRIHLAIFGLLVPLISAYVVVVWAGEVLRMTRAGAFLVGLAHRMNSDLPSPALSWDAWCRAGRDLRAPYIVTSAFFLLLAAGTPLIGVYGLDVPWSKMLWLAIVSWTAVVAAGAYLFIGSRRYRRGFTFHVEKVGG